MASDSKLYDYHKVLDHGFVKLIDVMGSEKAIVDAARVSYGKHQSDNTELSDKDIKLLKRLYKDRHTSPFEMAEIKMHIKMPIMIQLQWERHRTWNMSYKSGRYTEQGGDEDSFYIPEYNSWRLQHDNNKQMSSEEMLDSGVGGFLTEAMYLTIQEGVKLYKHALSHGVAREQARIFLPAYCLYTEGYLKIDIHNLMSFLRLRNHEHAQYEIRVYAKCILENILKPLFPSIYELMNS